MNSPFAIFRKHQKAAMVVLVFLSMFAFIVFDAIQKMEGLPTFVSALLLGGVLGGVFWFFGNDNEKRQGKEYALLGALIGFAAGIIGPQLNRPASAFYSKVGNLSQQELRDLIARRQIANQFLSRASQKISAKYLKQHPDTPPNLIPRIPEPYFFNLMFEGMPHDQMGMGQLQQDVSMAFFFRREADRMGIRVSDAAVTKFIRNATSDKLSADDFHAILRDMQVGETTLYDYIREEMKSKMAFDCLRPRNFRTPDDYWEIYRKLHVREQLEVTAVPVSAFVPQVSEPSSTELDKFFNEYKGVMPTGEVTATPAFGQPRKVQLAYIAASFRAEEGPVAAALDKEIADAEARNEPTPIEKYYEEHKDRYRNFNLPDNASSPGGKKDKGPALKFPDEPEKAEPGKTEPPKSDTEKPGTEKPSSEKKRDEKKPSDEAKPDEKKPEEKKSEEKKPDAPKPDAPKDGSSDNDSTSDEEQLEDNEAAEPKDPKPAEEKAGEKSEKPDNAKTGDAKPEKPASPADDALPAAIPADDGAATAEIPGEPLPEEAPSTPPLEYRPLDAGLKDEIRSVILNERVAARLTERIQEAEAEMTREGDKYHDSAVGTAGRGKPRVHTVKPQDIADHLQAWAKEHQMKFVVTTLLSYDELSNGDEHPIGTSTEASGNMFTARPVAQMAFTSTPELLYVPSVSVDRISGDRFCWWKVQDNPPYEPKLTDPGMEEKVIAAWKTYTARPLAETRAKELVELLNKADGKPWSEVLADQTVTGKPEGLHLTVRETESFSWLREPTAPQMSFYRQPPELSRISAVESADDAFMTKIFTEMKDGDTGVVPNADKSVYYVVKVVNRVPTTDAGEEELRKQFLETRDMLIPGSGYDQLIRQEGQARFGRWMQDLRKKYEIELNVADRQ